jgi:hypothetical protein
MELHPAKAAVVDPTAGQSLDQVQKPPFHSVDPVALLEPDHAECPAPRASAEFAQMEPVPARRGDDLVTIAALEFRHVGESFR